MSMAFQRGLVNNPFAQQQASASEVANLSMITLKPAHQEGGWLHSHAHRYPIYPSGDKAGLVSSYQQQVGWRALLLPPCAQARSLSLLAPPSGHPLPV